MPEYDAFGREIGEDTLAGLGGTSESSSAQPAPLEMPEHSPYEAPEQAAQPAFETPEPAEEILFEVAEPQAPPRPEPPQQPPSFQLPPVNTTVVQVRRRSGLGCFIGLLFLLAVVAVPVVALIGFVDSAEDTIGGITDVFDSDTEPATPDEPAGAAKLPKGIAGRSLIARDNLGGALRRLRKAGLGGIAFARLAPDRLDAQLIKGSRQRSAEVNFEGELVRGTASQGAKRDAIPYGAIDRSAPARLVRGSAARFHVREREIDYLVLSPAPAGGHRWVAYFKNQTYVEGDRHGRVIRRIN